MMYGIGIFQDRVGEFPGSDSGCSATEKIVLRETFSRACYRQSLLVRMVRKDF